MKDKIAIIAGKGKLPIYVAHEILKTGTKVYIFPIEGSADADYLALPHLRLKIGEIGKFFHAYQTENCTKMVLVGKFDRPELNQVKFDWGAVKRIPDMMSFLMGGDNAILERITCFFENEGVVVSSIPELAPELMVKSGTLSNYKPNTQMMSDASLGFELLNQIGLYDVGQACVVKNGRILAIEAAEGTDGMLKRLRETSAFDGAILVKAPKPKQEMRNDMPVIGPETIELAYQSGLLGVALKSNGVLLSGVKETISTANKLKIALWGVL